MIIEVILILYRMRLYVLALKVIGLRHAGYIYHIVFKNV